MYLLYTYMYIYMYITNTKCIFVWEELSRVLLYCVELLLIVCNVHLKILTYIIIHVHALYIIMYMTQCIHAHAHTLYMYTLHVHCTLQIQNSLPF